MKTAGSEEGLEAGPLCFGVLGGSKTASVGGWTEAEATFRIAGVFFSTWSSGSLSCSLEPSSSSSSSADSTSSSSLLLFLFAPPTLLILSGQEALTSWIVLKQSKDGFIYEATSPKPTQDAHRIRPPETQVCVTWWSINHVQIKCKTKLSISRGVVLWGCPFECFEKGSDWQPEERDGKGGHGRFFWGEGGEAKHRKTTLVKLVGGSVIKSLITYSKPVFPLS